MQAFAQGSVEEGQRVVAVDKENLRDAVLDSRNRLTELRLQSGGA